MAAFCRSAVAAGAGRATICAVPILATLEETMASKLRAGLVGLAVVCVLASAVHAAGGLTYVWWEGEDAFEHKFNNTAFAANSLDNPEALSGGQWLNTGGT